MDALAPIRLEERDLPAPVPPSRIGREIAGIVGESVAAALTDWERDCAELLLAGFLPAQVAGELGCSAARVRRASAFGPLRRIAEEADRRHVVRWTREDAARVCQDVADSAASATARLAAVAMLNRLYGVVGPEERRSVSGGMSEMSDSELRLVADRG